MATQSPFQFLESVFNALKPGPTGGALPNLSPPAWAIDEAQRRIVLLLNHVLMQEKEATSRLARQKGRVVLMNWRSFAIKLIATPAGLLDLAPPAATPDLTLVVTQESPFEIAQAVLRGGKPGVRIEGDVQLAAEVNWLADHVRWDAEEDLSRIVGDVPAHALGQAARSIGQALRQFVGARAASAPASASGTATP
jgi:ubiquinone biosynthesis protein UbiJ